MNFKNFTREKKDYERILSPFEGFRKGNDIIDSDGHITTVSYNEKGNKVVGHVYCWCAELREMPDPKKVSKKKSK